ncbi:hypothetical protein V5799_026680 [Amblyomma americanum]|uniref:Fibronectin type-III domain-containing protein n=1 Tax=Amblyomma americanum TaxID=6943 RepID=A0AAQ4DHV9_AMBAM
MQLPALDNVSVRATCDSFIIASWNYSLEDITGFLLNLCADGQSCITRTVDKADQEHTFKVDPVLRQYTLSLEAYIWKGNTKYASVGVNTSVASFPEVPRLEGFEVEAVSLREVRATWKVPIDVDVRLHVCPLESPRKSCVNYVAHGTRLAYTISGLSPSTKYSIEASGAVTLGANTCLGFGITREITTLTEGPMAPTVGRAEAADFTVPYDVNYVSLMTWKPGTFVDPFNFVIAFDKEGIDIMLGPMAPTTGRAEAADFTAPYDVNYVSLMTWKPVKYVDPFNFVLSFDQNDPVGETFTKLSSRHEPVFSIYRAGPVLDTVMDQVLKQKRVMIGTDVMLKSHIADYFVKTGTCRHHVTSGVGGVMHIVMLLRKTLPKDFKRKLDRL